MTGRTQTCMPFKGAIAQVDHDLEEIIVAQVDIKYNSRRCRESVYAIEKVWEDGYIHDASGNCIKDSKI